MIQIIKVESMLLSHEFKLDKMKKIVLIKPISVNISQDIISINNLYWFLISNHFQSPYKAHTLLTLKNLLLVSDNHMSTLMFSCKDLSRH